MRGFRSLQVMAVLLAMAFPAIVTAQDALFIDADGDVGIGTSTPNRPLHVVATNAPQNTVIELVNSGSARFRIRNSATGETWNVGHRVPDGTGLVFSDVGDAVSEMLLDVDGNMTLAGSLTTAGGSYPDYVFADSYPLMPLSDLASYIEEKGHLPKIPTAADVEERGGVNMSELQLLLLEKVEELTLYTLAQQKQIEAQQVVINELRKDLDGSGGTAGQSK